MRADARETTFRLDINALRALSVIAVLGYHLRIPGFAGGFVGVDVFLVITGYLMTGKVLADLAAGVLALVVRPAAHEANLSGACGCRSFICRCRLVRHPARRVSETSEAGMLRLGGPLQFRFRC